MKLSMSLKKNKVFFLAVFFFAFGLKGSFTLYGEDTTTHTTEEAACPIPEDETSTEGAACPMPDSAIEEAAPESKGWFSLENVFNVETPFWLILIFAFLYGILVSFTPCVYPMIPITAAVLQSQATRSGIYNFFLALSYVFGTAMVFATLGYIAATTTVIFGQWAGNPWVILFILAVLLYLAGSLFGLYELYIPAYLTRKKEVGTERKGSLVYTFFAGMIAGSVSSPCLSPVLVTVLIYVAKLGNPIMGFLTLFSFALGIGVLLVLVGTSSAALALLPKAGTWMVEIKRFFGFLILGLMLYFLSLNPHLDYKFIVIPTDDYLIAFLLALLLGAMAVYYFKSGMHSLKKPPMPTMPTPEQIEGEVPPQVEQMPIPAGQRPFTGYFKLILGVALLIGSAFFMLQAYIAFMAG